MMTDEDEKKRQEKVKRRFRTFECSDAELREAFNNVKGYALMHFGRENIGCVNVIIDEVQLQRRLHRGLPRA